MDWYDKQGRAITVEEAMRLRNEDGTEYKRVGRDEVGTKVISTVWLGLDHQYDGGPPLIFETMVFDGSWSEEECHRYPTLAEAEAGHAAVVARIRAELGHG